MCVWLPQWPLQRLRSAQPELKRCELVLYAPERGCFRVVACSGKYGVRMGMPLAEATALAPAHFQQHDPQADQQALAHLAAWCEQFSPIVGIQAARQSLPRRYGAGIAVRRRIGPWRTGPTNAAGAAVDWV